MGAGSRGEGPSSRVSALARPVPGLSLILPFKVPLLSPTSCHFAQHAVERKVMQGNNKWFVVVIITDNNHSNNENTNNNAFQLMSR